jgi:hypothetical protein
MTRVFCPSCPTVRRATFVAAAAALTAVSAPAARAATVASSVPAGTYTMGEVFTASGTLFNDPAAALGKPNPIVGTGFFAGAITPFNSHYENTDLVAIGRGGTITLKFAAPVPVGAGAEIGVHTSASFNDVDYPAGTASGGAQTFAALEYGADRSAVVEVGDTLGHFVSLGRVKFDAPSNAFADVNDPYLFGGSASWADYGKPFLQPTSAFGNKTFAQSIALLNGSAGGTWLDVPVGAGLTEVNFIRFSDPQWILPSGQIADTRTSIFDATYVKKGDLFIDGVAGVPEPGAIGAICVALTIGTARRRR